MNRSPRARRVLLVSPVFHGYWQAIASALRARGHRVEVHCYDARETLAARLVHKLGPELAGRLRGDGAGELAGSTTTHRALERVRAAAPDVVVTVKGDVLGDDYWDELDRRRIPRVTWLYDEVRRLRYSPQRLAGIGPIASYSPRDVDSLVASGADASHLPLAYDAALDYTPSPSRELVFVGARYPARGGAADAPGRDRERRCAPTDGTGPDTPSTGCGPGARAPPRSPRAVT